MDTKKIEEAVRNDHQAVGEDEFHRGTSIPTRIAKMYQNLRRTGAEQQRRHLSKSFEIIDNNMVVEGYLLPFHV